MKNYYIIGMEFGDILDAWDKKQKQAKKKNIMADLLDDYLPDKRVFQEKNNAAQSRDSVQARRKQLLAKEPQRILDLHGYAVAEAIRLLEKFLIDCKREGLQKVLIIHGKGNHSNGTPVLRTRILQYIQTSPLTGEHGFAPKNMGGCGALWVILR